MPREFKPVRFSGMMAVAAFLVCGVTAFYAHRAVDGRSTGGTGGVLDPKESGRGSARRREIVGTGRGEHDRRELFSAAGVGQQTGLESCVLNMTTRRDSRRRVRTGDRKPNIEHEAVGEV
jgi:hypothetical protein